MPGHIEIPIKIYAFLCALSLARHDRRETALHGAFSKELVVGVRDRKRDGGALRRAISRVAIGPPATMPRLAVFIGERESDTRSRTAG